MDTEYRQMVRNENSRQLQLAKLSRAPRAVRTDIVEQGVQSSLLVTRLGVGPLITPMGEFELFSFSVSDSWEKYSVVYCGALDDQLQPKLRNAEEFLLRIDSGCETGQLFLDQTCECREQLHEAMREVSDRGEGAVINIPRQDGRGMGLPFKLATLRLQQEFGVDTVQAAAMVEPVSDRDTRTYGGALAVLKYLGVLPPTRILLATNNPKKIGIFEENGFELARKSIVIEATQHTRHHLNAKNEHLGHMESDDMGFEDNQ